MDDFFFFFFQLKHSKPTKNSWNLIVLSRDGNFTPPHPTPLRKVGGVGMGQYFVPAPQGGAGIG